MWQQECGSRSEEGWVDAGERGQVQLAQALQEAHVALVCLSLCYVTQSGVVPEMNWAGGLCCCTALLPASWCQQRCHHQGH